MHSAASRNHKEDGGWKSREKSQGNVCQGNNPENAFSHSLDSHSPDFAFDNVFNRMGGLKILAKMERNRVSRKSCRKCAIFHYSGTDSESSASAATGKQFQQKQTKATKNPDSESGLRFLRSLLFKRNPCYSGNPW
jgi:hypothetical protein